MKLLFPVKPVLLSAGLLFCLSSCEKTKHTETKTTSNDTDTVTVRHTETRTGTSKSADKDLKDFKNWVNRKTSSADSSTKEHWPKIKEDFKERTDRLESRLDSMSVDSKREYAEYKARYKNWETRQERRQNQPLDKNKIATWEQQLLGKQSSLKTITATGLHDAYLNLLTVVRAKHNTWTPDDWDYVDFVYSELNNRKDELESDISAGEKLKIKALQGEYLGYEGAADVKDAAHNVKK
jgi:hypothetical protein